MEMEEMLCNVVGEGVESWKSQSIRGATSVLILADTSAPRQIPLGQRHKTAPITLDFRPMFRLIGC